MHRNAQMENFKNGHLEMIPSWTEMSGEIANCTCQQQKAIIYYKIIYDLLFHFLQIQNVTYITFDRVVVFDFFIYSGGGTCGFALIETPYKQM